MGSEKDYEPKPDPTEALTPQQRERLDSAIREGIGDAAISEDVILASDGPEETT